MWVERSIQTGFYFLSYILFWGKQFSWTEPERETLFLSFGRLINPKCSSIVKRSKHYHAATLQTLSLVFSWLYYILISFLLTSPARVLSVAFIISVTKSEEAFYLLRVVPQIRGIINGMKMKTDIGNIQLRTCSCLPLFFENIFYFITAFSTTSLKSTYFTIEVNHIFNQ